MALDVSFSLYKSIQVCPGIFLRLLWLISRIPQHIIVMSPSLSFSLLLLSSPLYSSSPYSLFMFYFCALLLRCILSHSLQCMLWEACGGAVWQWWVSPTFVDLRTLQYPPRRQQALSRCLHCNNCVTFAESGVQSGIEVICTSSCSHACLVKLDQNSGPFEGHSSLIINIWLW